MTDKKTPPPRKGPPKAQALQVEPSNEEIYKLNRSAFDAGKAAAEAGHPIEAVPEYPAKSLGESWLKGFKTQKPEHRFAPPPTDLEKRKPSKENPGHFWPENEALPSSYKVRKPAVPCENCRRLCMPDASQAVCLVNTDQKEGVAWFKCRSCKHRFKLGLDQT